MSPLTHPGPGRPRRAVRFLESSTIVLVGLLLIMGILYGSKVRSLLSLKKVSDFPLYVMTYYGDYDFRDFLKQGAESDEELEEFVIQKILLGQGSTPLLDPGIDTAFACSAFSAANGAGEGLVGRNFDFHYSPALLLFTNPPGGYASVSMVNLGYLGFSEENLPTVSLSNLGRTLAAPYLAFDGMNERGVVMALLAVPEAEVPKREGRSYLNTTTAIRLVLDYAKDVDEAVSLLKDYNLYWSADIPNHYFIADATGKSVIVEFVDGEMRVIPRDGPWQAVTNFVVSDPEHPGDGHERYEKLGAALKGRDGRLEQAEAMQLLADVSIPKGTFAPTHGTLWSLVYNQSTGDISIALGRDYDSRLQYELEMANEKK